MRKIHINDYQGAKLVQHLQPGQKNLIAFGHGWGDTLMFMPIYEAIKELYPHVEWHIYVESGQEQIIKTSPIDGDYDYIFHIHYPMGEGSGKTKNATCCEQEIGIEPVEGVMKLKKYKSPLVAVHFHGTALPDSVNCDSFDAALIWDAIRKVGLVPIECHFKHIYHNPVNSKYPFIDCAVRSAKPRLQSLIGLLQHCYAFIGVASGPFVTALSVMPKKTLLLEKRHSLTDYVPQGIGHSIKVQDVTEEKIVRWLKSLQSAK